MPLRHPILSTASVLRRPTYIRIALFHTTQKWRSETLDLYKTLGLEHDASNGDIKKYDALNRISRRV